MRQRCENCIKALAVKARFRIYQHLSSLRKQVTITELVKLVSLRQPTVTFHVNRLAAAGLIVKKKLGRKTFCAANVRCKHCALLP